MNTRNFDFSSLSKALELNNIDQILVYGTGKYAEELVNNPIDGVGIIGFLDRVKMDGTFHGYPVLSWEDVNSGIAEAIVIASAKKSEDIIFRRIMYFCKAYGLTIFNVHGDNLTALHSFESLYYGNTLFSDRRYYRRTRQELQSIIDGYDAISFDLFDTLITRQVLEPIDIFDIVEERLADAGILIEKFKRKRRTAELEIGYGNINDIYVKFGELYGYDNSICDRAKNIELECELDFIKIRQDMVVVMDYAYEQGKTVTIISDMYLPEEILKKWLSNLGIHNYNNLMVSCDYGCGKSSGIFEIYKKALGENKKCLHVGDNLQSDVLAPQKYGISSYEIKSGYSLLEMSDFRALRLYENEKGCRRLLGIIIADLFNSPFALAGTMGEVRIDNIELFAKICIAPTVYVYLSKLRNFMKDNDFDGVLLSARDGYIFKRIIDEGIMSGFDNKELHYFLTSRKVASKATINDENDIEEIKELMHVNDDQECLEKLFQIKATGESKNELINQSHKCKLRYDTYLEREGISLEKKYILCDLISSGTVLHRLKKMFKNNLIGYFLYRTQAYTWRKIEVEAVFTDEDTTGNRRVPNCVNLLEKIITAPSPTVVDFDEDGNPVFDSDERTQSELEMVEKAQNAIIQWIKTYEKVNSGEEKINTGFAREMLFRSMDIIFEKEAKILDSIELKDDLNGLYLPLRR